MTARKMMEQEDGYWSSMRHKNNYDHPREKCNYSLYIKTETQKTSKEFSLKSKACSNTI